jgi:hypothetical protein
MGVAVEYDILAAYVVALAESDDPDAREVARQVAATTPDEALRSALERALVALAPTMVTRERSQLRAHGSNGNAPRSKRWEQAVAEHNAILRQRIATATGMVFLGEATVEQVRYAARLRRHQAAAMETQATWFERLAKAMEDRGATVVRDLPGDVLSEMEALA